MMGEDERKTAKVIVQKGALSGVYVSILKKTGEESGNYRIVVTSTCRTPHDQARIMFENIERNGVQEQKRTYRAPGREVIAVYEKLSAEGRKKEEIVGAMERKIVYLGPENVSKHCSDRGNVADVSKSNLSYPDEFLRAVRPKVSQVLDENGCFHIVF